MSNAKESVILKRNIRNYFCFSKKRLNQAGFSGDILVLIASSKKKKHKTLGKSVQFAHISPTVCLVLFKHAHTHLYIILASNTL